MKRSSMSVVSWGLALLAMVAAVIWSGCASTAETGQSDPVTASVGNFSPAPAGVQKPRVGVPPFNVQSGFTGFTFDKQELESIAADQATTLLFRTNRFKVIERAQLGQLLREQDLEGIVRPGELAGLGQVRGVDYLMLGKVTAFRIKSERKAKEVGVGGYVAREWLGGIGGGVNQEEIQISTELGVDIRLVDPSSGEIAVAHFSDFKRTDSAKSMGINVAGVGGQGDADIRISRDDAGKVLRLAFDDALKKMMPEIDRMLRSTSASSGAAPSNTAPAAASPADGGADDTAGPKFCPQCGEKLAAGAKFCASCGHKIE